MEGIEWSRPMASLLPGLHSSSVSKLPSADCQPPSTPMGHSFNPLENRLRQKNTEIYLFVHSNYAVFYCLRKKSLWKSYEEIKPV